MDVITGQTIYENVLSVDVDGNPVSAATFSTTFFLNGSVTTDVTLTLGSISPTTGVFSASFVPVQYGFHQFRIRNATTGTIYMSDIYVAKPADEIGLSVYVGI